MIDIFLEIFLLLVCFLLFLMLVLPDKSFKDSVLYHAPLVSILIPVRNEERNLPGLFHSLLQLDYPRDRLEVIFGNDKSSDASLVLIQKFCSLHPWANYREIKSSKKQIAKANVIMQLAQEARGQYFYFMDADMRPNTDIIYAFLKKMTDGIGAATGISIPIARDYFSKWQQIDWVFALSMVSKAQGMNQDTTAMGNNMMVSRAFYEEVGGYENLKMSMVEDYILYKAIREKGREFPLIFSKKVLSFTKAVPNFYQLLMQRKRWMSGGMQVKLSLKLILLLQALYYPVAILCLFFLTKLILVTILIKFSIQSFFIWQKYQKVSQEVDFFDLVSYEIYSGFLTLILLIFYFIPIKVNWKGRKFKTNLA